MTRPRLAYGANLVAYEAALSELLDHLENARGVARAIVDNDDWPLAPTVVVVAGLEGSCGLIRRELGSS